MSMLSFLRRSVLLTAFFATTVTQAAPLLLVNNGILVGADKVDVGGTLYDVRFASGTCDDVFEGCDASAFAFRTAAQASLAANALLNQVFVDSARGQFDSRSDLSYNCGSNIHCDSIVPYSLEGAFAFQAVTARNMSQLIPAYSDMVMPSRYTTWYDTKRYYGGIGLESFAVFTVSAAEVSEPGTIGLIALALGMLAVRRRLDEASPPLTGQARP